MVVVRSLDCPSRRPYGGNDSAFEEADPEEVFSRALHPRCGKQPCLSCARTCCVWNVIASFSLLNAVRQYKHGQNPEQSRGSAGAMPVAPSDPQPRSQAIVDLYCIYHAVVQRSVPVSSVVISAIADSLQWPRNLCSHLLRRLSPESPRQGLLHSICGKLLPSRPPLANRPIAVSYRRPVRRSMAKPGRRAGASGVSWRYSASAVITVVDKARYVPFCSLRIGRFAFFLLVFCFVCA